MCELCGSRCCTPYDHHRSSASEIGGLLCYPFVEIACLPGRYGKHDEGCSGWATNRTLYSTWACVTVIDKKTFLLSAHTYPDAVSAVIDCPALEGEIQSRQTRSVDIILHKIVNQNSGVSITFRGIIDTCKTLTRVYIYCWRTKQNVVVYLWRHPEVCLVPPFQAALKLHRLGSRGVKHLHHERFGLGRPERGLEAQRRARRGRLGGELESVSVVRKEHM